MRAVGIDDSVHTCDCCGRSELKFTVAFVDDAGNRVHYGQVCASRNTGKTSSAIRAEILANENAQLQGAIAEVRSSSVFDAYRLRLLQRPRDLIGKPAADFIRSEYQELSEFMEAVAQRWAVPKSRLLCRV